MSPELNNKKYDLYPPVKEIYYETGEFSVSDIKKMTGTSEIQIPELSAYPYVKTESSDFIFSINGFDDGKKVTEEQGYRLTVEEGGICIHAADIEGLKYGLDTLEQILKQSDGTIRCLSIYDYPVLKKRGLMLDVSRGKVYTREYLLKLVELLSRLRYNVLQLYIEHTFDFKKHSEICEGSDPVTAEDIVALQQKCKSLGIELQPNLQSLGHCRRILTRRRYRNLAESSMFWSMDTTSDDVMDLLDDMYSEYLPLFESRYFNVGLDEPYDIGKGKNRNSGKTGEELYLEYLLKIHDLAAKYGKKIMVFGDVFVRNPELLKRLPDDIICLDWIYDPKESYETPQFYKKHNLTSWICPGTGNWNTLFPRLDGAITNIVNLTRDGVAAGAKGMLLTDWNDHGAYTQPVPGYYTYVYGGAVAWCGCDPGADYVDRKADEHLRISGYSELVHKLAEIYQIPPIWSKNRSECVMALFDEPIFGKSIRGVTPPANLRAYDLELPEGVDYVMERHSQHPLRPYFQIPEEVCDKVKKIVLDARSMTDKLPEGWAKEQFSYITEAFGLLLDKMEICRNILERFQGKSLCADDLMDMEEEVNSLLRRYTRLQIHYEKIWLSVAKMSEIEISLTYFGHIIERLDYLKDWLMIQREKINLHREPDYTFVSYETAGYETLPTY